MHNPQSQDNSLPSLSNTNTPNFKSKTEGSVKKREETGEDITEKKEQDKKIGDNDEKRLDINFIF